MLLLAAVVDVALIGGVVAPNHAADKIIVKIVGMKLFAEYIMGATNGKYDVRVFPNSQLDSEDAYIAQTRRDFAQMCATGADRSRDRFIVPGHGDA